MTIANVSSRAPYGSLWRRIALPVSAVALTAAALILAPVVPARAQVGTVEKAAASASTAAASSANAAAPVSRKRDLHLKPPSARGEKLQPGGPWTEGVKVLHYSAKETKLPPGKPGDSGVIDERRYCEVHLQNDWLRFYCAGLVGRVNQLAGSTKDAVIHISHSWFRLCSNPKNGKPVPCSESGSNRALIYYRLTPGESAVFEMTRLGYAPYNGNFFENASEAISIDWSDESEGPVVRISEGITFW